MNNNLSKSLIFILVLLLHTYICDPSFMKFINNVKAGLGTTIKRQIYIKYRGVGHDFLEHDFAFKL